MFVEHLTFFIYFSPPSKIYIVSLKLPEKVPHCSSSSASKRHFSSQSGGAEAPGEAEAPGDAQVLPAGAELRAAVRLLRPVRNVPLPLLQRNLLLPPSGARKVTVWEQENSEEKEGEEKVKDATLNTHLVSGGKEKKQVPVKSFGHFKKTSARGNSILFLL